MKNWLLIVLCLLVTSCGKSEEEKHFSQLFGKTLIVGFWGDNFGDRDMRQVRELIDKELIAGVILFRHNIQSPQQLKELIRYIKGTRDDVIISVDQEGGKVSRLDERNGFPHTMPTAKSYTSEEEVYDSFFKMGTILEDVGINLDFAPVLDVDYNPPSPVIGAFERSFSLDPEIVVAYGRAVLRALAENGVLACGKHFPGHGSAQNDSHLEFTDVTQYWNKERELYPFIVLKDELPFIMVAHTFNSELDPELPASLSPATYKLLKDYQGKFVTDDYFMVAVAQKYNEFNFAIKALGAGASLVIYSNHPKLLKLLKKKKVSIKRFVKQLHKEAYQAHQDGKITLETLENRIR